MNAPLLLLPALAAMMVVSVAQTLPPDLRQDAAGKTPLTAFRMTVARGAGSTCRLGCNEPNTACAPKYDENPGGYGQDWNPHNECAFALGSDTCDAGPDVLCNSYYYFKTYDCSTPAYRTDTTYSSTCLTAVPTPVDPGRNE